MKKLNINPTLLLFFIGSFMGLVIFLLLFGISTVDPFNINWIQNIKGDMTQHYIGWQYFRDAPWHFPVIGKIDGLAYPTGISLVYMDVIPLFAIIFKLFGGILPEQFQYFGIFTLLSFMLQGGFAAVIFRRFTNRTVLALIGTLFVICTPIILGRAFGHTALTAHWLVLCAIYYAIVFYQEKSSYKKQLVVWLILLSLSVLTHAYFIPIIGSIMLFSIVLMYKNIRESLLVFFVPVMTALLLFGAIGGFSRGVVTNGSSGLGLYATNVLGPIIPMGYSSLINSTVSHYQWEGLAYFGLGVLVLVPIVFYIALSSASRKSLQSAWKSVLHQLKSARVIILIIILLGVALFAFSPYIYVGDFLLPTIPTPGPIERLWETFRSTGRLFWPLYYAAIVCLIAYILVVTNKWKTWAIVGLLAPLVLLQAYDILRSPVAILKGQSVKAAAASHTPNNLNSSFIKNYCNRDIAVLTDNSIESGIYMFHDLSDFIITCQPKLTSGYFARFPKKAILDYANTQRAGLVNGAIDIPDSSLFLSQSKEFVAEINQDKYKATQYDKYFVIENK